MSSVNAVERERDVLRSLLLARRGAFIVWDHDLNPVWMSPEVQAWLGDETAREELNGAAFAAFCRLQPRAAAPGPSSVLALLQLGSVPARPMLAKFSCIYTQDGYRWLTAELTRYRSTHAKLETLTRAEANVLRLLVRGLSNREIGEKLHVSIETVRTHVRRLLNKLDVTSRSKAASVAREAWPECEDREPE